RVAVPAGSSGSFTYRVSVTSSNADPNRVDRTVVVIAPAALEAALPNGEITVRDGRWGNVPLPMTARITNVGQLVAEDVVARLDTVFGLQLARGSAAERYIGPVQPGETVEVTWHLVPTGVVGNLPVSLRLTSSNASIGRLPTAFVAVPLLESVLRVTVDDEAAVRKEAVVGDLFTVYIHAENVRELYGAALELRFDPSV